MSGQRKIHIVRELVESLYRAKGGGDLPRNLMIAIRGATPFEAGGDLVVKTPNKPGFYNDAVGLVLGNRTLLYPGTTDAGSMAQVSGTDQDNAAGIFHLNDGIHRLRHHPHLVNNAVPQWLKAIRMDGFHARAAWRITTPPSGSKASGWRDVNDTDVRDSDDNLAATSEVINVHWGAKLKSGGPLKTEVGTQSVGCLNVVRDHWKTFRNLGYEHLSSSQATLLLVDASLLPDLSPATSLQLELNGTLLPSLEMPLWEDPPGKTVTYVRPLLDRVLVGGQPPAFTFHEEPDRLVFTHPANKTLRVTLKIENGTKRGVAGVRDTLSLLDPAADIRRSTDESKVLVTSNVISLRP